MRTPCRIIGCTLNHVKPPPRIRVLLFADEPGWGCSCLWVVAWL
jgi:hypothetical protein